MVAVVLVVVMVLVLVLVVLVVTVVEVREMKRGEFLLNGACRFRRRKGIDACDSQR